MQKSEEINELALALSKAQGKICGAAKNKENPFFKSRYSDLQSVWAACREALSQNELAIIQTTNCLESGVEVETVLAHSSGQWVSGTINMKSGKDDPQTIGKVITYARRYGLSAMVGVAPDDDDDGNAGSHPDGNDIKSPNKKNAENKAEAKEQHSAFNKWLETAKKAKGHIGAAAYYEILGGHGFEHANEVKTEKQQKTIYADWLQAAQKPRQQEPPEPGSDIGEEN